MYSLTRKLFNFALFVLPIVVLLQVHLVQAAPVASVELYAVDYPPYTIVNSDGVVSGIDVEVTKAAYAAVGIQVIISTAPWKRILKNMQHGHIAGSLTCSKRPGREAFILFSNLLSEANQVAVMAKDSEDSGIKVFSDLANFDVMVVGGWGIQGELERAGIMHRVTAEMDNGINAVAKRGVDVFYNGELTTRYRAAQLGLQNKLKYIRFTDKESTPFHLCLSKQYEHSDYLIERFNSGLSIIQGNGTYQAIYDKYLD